MLFKHNPTLSGRENIVLAIKDQIAVDINILEISSLEFKTSEGNPKGNSILTIKMADTDPNYKGQVALSYTRLDPNEVLLDLHDGDFLAAIPKKDTLYTPEEFAAWFTSEFGMPLEASEVSIKSFDTYLEATFDTYTMFGIVVFNIVDSDERVDIQKLFPEGTLNAFEI